MKTKAAARSTLGWAFGVAASILFLSLWGRAVVVDTDTLAESLAPLSGSAAVVDFVTDWMSDEMVDSGVDPTLVDPTIDYLLDSSRVGQSLDQFVVEVVEAAASTDPAGSSVDMAALVTPAIPELTVGLTELGYPASESEISDAVAGLDPLIIRRQGAEAIVGPASQTASRLGTAALLATIALLAFGFGIVALSEDRVAAVRSLLTRVAVGGLSFAVFLRLGSWVLDPNGGRAPVAAALSGLAGSKWFVPLQVGLVATVSAGGIYLTRQWIRRRGESRSASELPTRQRERTGSLSGSR